MVNFCAVVGCSNIARVGKAKKSYFRLPAVITHQGSRTFELSQARRRQWLANIRRSDITMPQYPYLRICSDHFVTGKPCDLYDETNPDWAPTLKMGHNKRALLSIVSAGKRYIRYSKRRHEQNPEVDSNSTLSGSAVTTSMLTDQVCNEHDYARPGFSTQDKECQTELTMKDLDSFNNQLIDTRTELDKVKKEYESNQLSESLS